MTTQDTPPSYAIATGSSNTSSKPDPTRLQVPQSGNGIPAASRRSMEDEHRPLPPGWVRQFDVKEQHQFFVDTHANPPRSIWHHPYDDDEFLRTLDPEERERIQEDEHERKRPLTPSSDHGDYHETPLPPRPVGKESTSAASHEKVSFGRKLKDKVTGSTHEERERERAQREEEERQYYQAHMKFRQALQQAQMTGQPQFFAKDRNGKDIYIEPPQGMRGGYGGNGYGYNPYSQGPYANPNARFIRPQTPYGRPYGPGYYGGGMGFPVMGGLLGGMMLGGLMF